MKIKKDLPIILILVLVLICVHLYFNQTSEEMSVHFINVGQGDSCLMLTPNKSSILIDGGGDIFSDYEVGKKVVKPYVEKFTNRLDAVIVSHYHDDHAKGIVEIMGEIEISSLILPYTTDTKNAGYRRLVDKAIENDIEYFFVSEGDMITVDDEVKIRVLSPDKIEDKEENNDSVVLRVDYGKTSFLFTGDAEKKVEKLLLKEDIDVDVLKLGHHGAKTSSSEEFLDATTPLVAVISVGENNPYGHPSDEVLESLKKKNIRYFRTDENGDISFILDKRGLKRTEILKQAG